MIHFNIMDLHILESDCIKFPVMVLLCETIQNNYILSSESSIYRRDRSDQRPLVAVLAMVRTVVLVVTGQTALLVTTPSPKNAYNCIFI